MTGRDGATRDWNRPPAERAKLAAPATMSPAQKIKRMRTADCVVGGFHWASGQRVVGSLLLGLYDDDGLLHHCTFDQVRPRSRRSA